MNEGDFLEQSICKRSYYYFFKKFWHTVSPETYIDNWHVEVLCDALQKVGERIIKRLPVEHNLLINISPSESKSTIVTQLFPCWLWANDSSLKIGSGSHDRGLSTDHAVKSRDCIKSDLYQKLFPHVVLKKDTDNKQKYATTNGGVRMAFSANSLPLGFHFHVLLYDDILNSENAESDAFIKSTNRWLGNMSTRKVDVKISCEIMVMQRLGENDPSAEFLRTRKDVHHICLPATTDYPIKPETLKYNYVDGLMNPKRKPYDVLEKIRKEVGERAYAGQYGQSPKPIDGNLFKTHHFEIMQWSQMPPAFYSSPTIAFGDLAERDKEKNDPTGLMAVKVYQNIMYVIDYVTYRERFVNNQLNILHFLQRHDLCPIVIENKSSGSDMVDSLLKNHSINAIEHKVPHKGKWQRAVSLIHFYDAGRVKILVNGRYQFDYQKFIEQHLIFDNGKHDEEVDLTTMAIRELFINNMGQGGKRRSTSW